MAVDFSDKELRQIADVEFLLSKVQITEKVVLLFGCVRDELKKEIEMADFLFRKDADITSGKISKGESYRHLPYVVLDYPKLFSNQSIFAFRTMFWWGNFFSLTMHLQGKALENYRENLLNNIQKIKNSGLYICVNDSPWEYHQEKDNYLSCNSLEDKELEKIINEKEFVKLSTKWGLDEWHKLIVEIKTKFNFMLSLLA